MKKLWMDISHIRLLEMDILHEMIGKSSKEQ